MYRATWRLILVIGLGTVLAACASPAGTSGESTGGEPSAPAAESEPAAETEAPPESEPPAESEAASGGEAPALADGSWTDGHGLVTVSGSMDLTVDTPLDPGPSSTEDAKTLLAYNAPDNVFVTIFINFTGIPFQANVTSGSSHVESDDCEVTYAQADDSAIDATFTCEGGDFTIEGTITATR